MSTIIDLNTATTVNFNNESSYAIVFGANAGNTTANVGPLGTANITQQTTLTSITSAVRDLLIDVQFSNVGVVDMNYVGTYSNIGILQIAPAAWRVSGIRSTAQYTEAMANVKYTDLTGIVYDSAPNYSYVTTVNDQSGNTRTWNTTVDVNAYVNNMINRTYTTNTITQLFSTSTPSLDDEPDVGQTYTITLNSSLGKFGNSDAYFSSNTFANLANTYTFTGNTSTVNANYSNIRFAPTNRVSGNGTFTYTQSRSGNTQVSLVKTLTANVQPFASGNTYTITSTGTFTPTFEQAQYGLVNVLLVGGGGGHQPGNTLPGMPFGGNVKFSGGAGGGGEVRYLSNIAIPLITYTANVGVGGETSNTNVSTLGTWTPGGVPRSIQYIANSGAQTALSGGNIQITAEGGLGGRWRIDSYDPADYSPDRWEVGLAEFNRGGNGGGNLSIGNITGGNGGGVAGSNTSQPQGLSGVTSGNSSNGSTGGAGGGYPTTASLVPFNGGAGVTHPLTGNLVLGGGGGAQTTGSLPTDSFYTGTPGGNSYGLGAGPTTTTGANGVIIINIT